MPPITATTVTYPGNKPQTRNPSQKPETPTKTSRKIPETPLNTVKPKPYILVAKPYNPIITLYPSLHREFGRNLCVHASSAAWVAPAEPASHVARPAVDLPEQELLHEKKR